MPVEVPKGRDAATLADWAELLVLSAEGSSVSAVRLNRLLRGEGTDQAEEELALYAETELAAEGEPEVELLLIDEGRGELEVHIERLLDEIELRLKLGPGVYPFERRTERVVRRSAPAEYAYMLLLVLSWTKAQARVERRLHAVEVAFDSLALEAIRRYLGRGARGIRFAKNAHDPTDNATRPKNFRDAITWLRKELSLGEGKRLPPDHERVEHWEDEGQPEEIGRTPLNSYEDGGVDVVAWWRFADERHGAPVLLAQCTVQLAWEEKLHDIDLIMWEKWIDFATVPPQRALVIPFAVSRTAQTWNDRTSAAGVIIDRLRLMELLTELEEDELESLVDQETREWVDNELAAAA